MDSLRERLQQKWVMTVLALIIGIGLGLVYGWVISPVQWKDATPSLLRPDLRVDYLRMTIDSYTVNKDVDLAIQRYHQLGAQAADTLKEVGADPGEVNTTAIQNFSALVEIFEAGPTSVSTTSAVATSGTPVSQATAMPATAVPTGASRAASFILPACGVTLLLGLLLVGALVLRGRLGGSSKETTLDEAYDIPDPYAPGDDFVAPDVYDAGEPYPPPKDLSGSDFGGTQPASAGGVEALGTFRTIYNLGEDLYDDSFSVESPSGDFIGECGVGISDVMGAGEPKKVSAFEVWLFDKNDIQTVTKVLMSKYAYNDESTRNQLAAKGDPVLAEPGAVVSLETASLIVEARVVDMTYGQSALPSESFFERMTIEINAYPR